MHSWDFYLGLFVLIHAHLPPGSAKEKQHGGRNPDLGVRNNTMKKKCKRNTHKNPYKSLRVSAGLLTTCVTFEKSIYFSSLFPHQWNGRVRPNQIQFWEVEYDCFWGDHFRLFLLLCRWKYLGVKCVQNLAKPDTYLWFSGSQLISPHWGSTRHSLFNSLVLLFIFFLPQFFLPHHFDDCHHYLSEK